MDEIVLRAIAKWPDVPAVYGWLALDRRGNWLLKGERVLNPALVDFICRNYGCDAQGRWFFQNGPQRVFVELAYTPLVYRTQSAQGASLQLVSHTGAAARQTRALWLDDAGAFLAETDLGIGVMHDQDLPEVLGFLLDRDSGERLDDRGIERLLESRAAPPPAARLWVAGIPVPVDTIRAEDVPSRFGFNPDPRPAPGEPDC